MRLAAWLTFLTLLAFAFQGSRALWEPDEGRYTDIAIQMSESGDWWAPRLHDEQPHFAKPPLTYWLIAASLSFFGRKEWAARLPYELAFLLTALLVRQIALDMSYRRADVAAFIWISALGPFLGFNFVTADAFLALFETAAVAAFVRAQTTHQTSPRAWIRAMWVMFALGFLTKGPPALLPLLSAVLWLSWRHRHSDELRAIGFQRRQRDCNVVVQSSLKHTPVRFIDDRQPMIVGVQIDTAPRSGNERGRC